MTTDGRDVRFLIVGMARSGTTVVQRLLCELETVWVPEETHFWRHAAALTDRHPPPLDREAVLLALSWFAGLESSQGLDLDLGSIAERMPEQSYLWDLFVGLVAHLSPADRQLLGEKTPDHLRWSLQLLGAVPHLEVVGMVRDPREVFRSHQTVPWGINDPWVFAEKWVEFARTLEDLERLYEERVIVLRYEDVASAPDETRDSLGHFLGAGTVLKELPEQLAIGGRLFVDGEWWKEGAFERIAPVDGRWKEEVEPEAISVIEWRAGDEMERLGYELSKARDPSLSPGARRDALLAVRMAGERSGAQILPVNVDRLEEWRNSLEASAVRWKQRAEDLRENQRRLRDWLEAEKEQSEQLGGLLAEETSAHRRTTDEKRRLERSLTSQTIGRLEAERGRLMAAGWLSRTQGRRWWRLGEALGRWRRQPWRLDRLARDLWQLAFRPTLLPPLPDVRAIDYRLAELRAASPSVVPGSEQALDKAKLEFEAGAYEAALAILEAAPSEVRRSREGALLARDSRLKLGDMTGALAEVRLALRVRDDPDLRRQARHISGRLRETDPTWLPDAGPPVVGYEPQEGAVLHILKESLPYFERGYTIRSRMTLLAQLQAGFHPSVVTSLGFPRDQGIGDFPLQEIVDGVTHYRLDLGPAYRDVPYDLQLSDQAVLTNRLAAKVRPALIQAGSGYRGYETALVGLAVARRLGVPFVYEIRSFLEQTWTGEVGRSEEGEYYQRRSSQEVRCLKEAEIVITIADAMRDEIVGRGIPPEKVAVVPNVVDVDRFQPREKPRALARRYGLDGRFVLGYVSNLSPREGIENLIQAVALMRSRDVAGLIVGDGPDMDRLAALVSELGLTGHVVLTGHVPNDQIEQHYALIDVFVVPRINERASRLVTPLKPLEAMAMGVPVLVSDLPALRELTSPEERGLVFPAEDPEALAAQATRLMDDDDLRLRVSSGAREWVMSERTVASNAERYEAILGSLEGEGG